MKDQRQILIYGDNIEAMNYLLTKPNIAENVRLVYTDPPYGTGQSFTMTDKRKSSISRRNNGRLAYGDNLIGKAYLEFIEERLYLTKKLMAEDGNIYLHIDAKMGHYVKCLMDEIFGQKNFINDITRIKCNPKNFARKGYGNIKDVILFYSKSNKYVWNNPRKKVQIEIKRFKISFYRQRRKKIYHDPAACAGRNYEWGKPEKNGETWLLRPGGIGAIPPSELGKIG